MITAHAMDGIEKSQCPNCIYKGNDDSIPMCADIGMKIYLGDVNDEVVQEADQWVCQKFKERRINA